jgi:hypothetical protein
MFGGSFSGASEMISKPNDSSAPRREFLGRLAGGTALLAAGGFAAACAAPAAAPAVAAADDEAWLKPLTGKHKQVFDAPRVNEAMPLMFAWAYLNTMNDTYKLKPGDANAFIVFRHYAAPLGLQDDIWKKYKLGAMLGIMDPATKKPSERNFVFKPKAGDMPMPDASADKMIAMPGVVVGVCGFAIKVLSEMASKGAGTTPEEAHKEWLAGVIPGAMVLPSGVLAVGRAQEHGCSYCFAG